MRGLTTSTYNSSTEWRQQLVVVVVSGQNVGLQLKILQIMDIV
jgi:hypothetical protein